MRGCPKVMPVADPASAHDTASFPNSTSTHAPRASFPVDDQRLGGQNVYSPVRLSQYVQSADAVFTALAPLKAPASQQGETYNNIKSIISDAVAVVSECKFVIMRNVVIGLCIGIALIILEEYLTSCPNERTCNQTPKAVEDVLSTF
ncbi:hypothetical protein SprV_0200643100 [Sparganum proliferum]